MITQILQTITRSLSSVVSKCLSADGALKWLEGPAGPVRLDILREVEKEPRWPLVLIIGRILHGS